MLKKLIFFAGIVLLMYSCRHKDDNSVSENEELVTQFFAYFNNHEWAKMASLYADTTNFKDPSLGEGIVKQTRTQTIKKYSQLHQLFPDIHDTIIHTYPAGEKNIIVEFISVGTGRDSSTFKLPICTIFTIEDGLITQDFTYFDNAEN